MYVLNFYIVSKAIPQPCGVSESVEKQMKTDPRAMLLDTLR